MEAKEETVELSPMRKKLETGIAAYKSGMVSMGYILDALDKYEAEVALLAVQQERERCAQLAEQQNAELRDNSSAPHIAAAECARKIAAAIRQDR